MINIKSLSNHVTLPCTTCLIKFKSNNLNIIFLGPCQSLFRILYEAIESCNMHKISVNATVVTQNIRYFLSRHHHRSSYLHIRHSFSHFSIMDS